MILGSHSGAVLVLDKALGLDGKFALAAAARHCVEQDNRGPNAKDYRILVNESAVAASDWEREHVDILFGLVEAAGEKLEKVRVYLERTPGDL